MSNAEPKITDDQANELMARLCHQLGVVVPGPAAGIQVCRAIEGVKRAMETCKGKAAAERALAYYLDALQFVAGVWAHQQKLVIGDLESAIAAGGGR